MSENNIKYPEPLPQYKSDCIKRFRLNQQTSWNVVSPFVRPEEEKNKKPKYLSKRKPSVLMSDIGKVLFEGTDIHSVLNDTAIVLKEATQSTEVTVYMVDEAVEEIYQVIHNYSLAECRISYKIQTGTNVAAHVASTKEFVKIDDLLEDIRFPEGLGNTELTVKSVLGVPVMTPEDECLAVFILNRDIDCKVYEDHHLRLIIVMCGWVGSTIFQNQQRLTFQKQQELNEYLLNLTKCYFADALPLDKLITEVVNFAKMALNAEHGSFFVIKKKDDHMYADCYEEGINADEESLFKKNIKLKLDDDEKDLVSIVAHTGEAINIRNAYNDDRVDQKKGYIIRSVLCLPIKGVDDILGVIQIGNKMRGSCFTKSDEILFHTFSVYCGFVLSYARLYEKMTKTTNYNEVYADMLSKQMQPCIHDYAFVHNHPEVSSFPRRFNQFDFYISDAFEHYMPQLVMYMFNEISRDMFQSVETLSKFVLIVQKSYHNHPYHNFFHAFNVCHCVYNMIRRNMDLFTITELRALVISAYCHDIDHYGVTNNFLEITNHCLSQLYDESVLENHHFHVTVLIIKFMKLFSFMSPAEYKFFIAEIKACILATDLATYFKRRGKLYQICSENLFNWDDDSHRLLLKSIMMTMADLSGLCKPYNTAKQLIDNVYKEFYNEGDKEKEMGLCPLSIMDREKKNMIPTDQVQFMTVVVLPCALILTKLLPNCGAIYREALKIRDIWQEIHDSQGQRLWTLEDSIPNKRSYSSLATIDEFFNIL